MCIRDSLRPQKTTSALSFSLSLIHISEPTRPLYIPYAVFCLKKPCHHPLPPVPPQHVLAASLALYFLMIRRPPRSTHCISSAASDVYKRQQYRRLKNNIKNIQQKMPTIPTILLSLIHISEPTRPLYISYAVFCLKKPCPQSHLAFPLHTLTPASHFFNDTATTEIYTLHIVGSVRCV